MFNQVDGTNGKTQRPSDPNQFTTPSKSFTATPPNSTRPSSSLAFQVGHLYLSLWVFFFFFFFQFSILCNCLSFLPDGEFKETELDQRAHRLRGLLGATVGHTTGHHCGNSEAQTTTETPRKFS